MGAGYYGIEPATCARVMLKAFQDYLGSETGIKEVVICVLDTPQHDAFQNALAALG
jgi:O-acetyl-ADP-ribose deacetylase (regulator of RNase III)